MLDTRDAVFSECRTWRYQLTRHWDPDLRALMVIGLNPSTADEQQDDPTIRRCIRFARDLGYGGVAMTNLYGFRATAPADLHKVSDPLGPDNAYWLRETAKYAGMVIAAWGADVGPYETWWKQIGWRIARAQVNAADDVHRGVYCLGTTRSGQPRHPLYLPAAARPEPWEPPDA